MEKVELQTADIAAENAAKLAELFPDIVTEVLDEDGNVCHSIDVEALKAHVGDITEDKRERYQFTWPGKQKARAEAIRPISKTMRPAPEESVNWDATENLYIEGDNLDALKILRETYAGKIKMIYIDPPYNTGHDFVYNDDFARSAEEERSESGAFDEEGNVLDAAYKVNNESNGKFHSDWCSMMYPRLVLARDLLSDDGVLFASINESEYATFIKLFDEIFGSQNHVVSIAWQNLDTVKNDAKLFSPNHEYLISYALHLDCFGVRGIKKGEKQRSYYKNPDGDPRGDYLLTPLHAKSGLESGIYTYTFENGQVWTPPTGTYPRYSRDTLRRLELEQRLYLDPMGVKTPQKKTFLSEVGDRMPPTSFWKYEEYGSTRQSNRELAELVGKGLFQNPKPSKLIGKIIDMLEDAENSTILDFFSGSATTAHAVMQLNAEDGGNRKFIMVQLPEVCDEKSEAAKAGYKNICEIGKERIRRAGAKIAAEVEESNAQLKLSEEPKKVPDIGFRVLKIDSTNFEDVSRTLDTLFQGELFGLADNLKSDRTPEDILFELLPKFQIPYTARIDKLDLCGKTVYSVDDDTLLACFDREVPEDVVRAMAEREPAYAVLRDASFVGDDALANFEEIFKTLSPATKTRVV